MFLINPRDPWHPKLIGTPAPSLGDTPVAVAYSTLLKTGILSKMLGATIPDVDPFPLVCVVNGGAITGIACFSVDDRKGLTALGHYDSFPQTENADPTAPPPGPLILASDIVFNLSSTARIYCC